MQSLRFALFVAVVAIGLPRLAAADVIQIGSFGTKATPAPGNRNTATTYGASGSTYSLPTSGRTWAPALTDSSWVSFDANASPGGSSTPANGTYVYQTTFTILDGSDFSGILQVMADDAASVLLNGYTLKSSTGATPGLSTAAMYLLPSLYLQLGLNTLEFDVRQIHSGATGLDFSGSVSTTPEPAPLLLLSTGLLGVWVAARRRAGLRLA